MLTFAKGKHGSYEYTGVDSTEKDDGSVPQQGQVPAVGNNDQSNSESSSASNDYNYDLSNDITSSSDANTDDSTDGSTDNIPKESSPDTNSYVASDVKAAEGSDKSKNPTLDPSVAGLLDLIEKTVNQLRKKLLGGSVHKRHARDVSH